VSASASASASERVQILTYERDVDSSIYLELILPLIKAWNNINVVKSIRKHLTVFKPEVSCLL